MDDDGDCDDGDMHPYCSHLPLVRNVNGDRCQSCMMVMRQVDDDDDDGDDRMREMNPTHW